MDRPDEKKTFGQSIQHFVDHLAFCYRDNKVIFWKYLAYSLKRAITYPFRRIAYSLDTSEQRYREAVRGKDEVMLSILGYKMLLPVSDSGLSRDLIIDGIREKNSVRVFFKEYRPGMHTVDLGANLGYYLLMEGKVARGTNTPIYAIEPNPHAFEYLKKNIKLNGHDNIKLMNLAVSDKKGSAPFYISKNWNCSRFTKGHDTSDITETRKMKIDTLDNLFKGKKVDFVRMDVEGYEFNILRGATKVIAANPKIAFFFEYHAQFFNTKQREEMIEFFRQHKLRVKYLFRGDEDGARMRPFSRGYRDVRNALYTTYYLYLERAA